MHAGPWAIDPGWAEAMLAYIKSGAPIPDVSPVKSAVDALRENDDMRAAGVTKIMRDANQNLMYQVMDGVAAIGIDGPMSKFDSKLGGTNTIRSRFAVRMANADPEVGSILLRIDSPGGHVAGTQELAADVAASAKPVTAFIEDQGASAAYWVASQAKKIIANEMALVGSIGTYAVVHDESKAADIKGIKVHVVSSGPWKGGGQPGTEITGEQLSQIQEIVDDYSQKFVDAVAAGRGMGRKDAAALADGRVWIASKAKKLGLIDQVGTLDEAMAFAADKAVRRLGRGAKADLLIRLAKEN